MAPTLLILHRAGLAGIAAANTHDYLLKATDSEDLMRQIRKQIPRIAHLPHPPQPLRGD